MGIDIIRPSEIPSLGFSQPLPDHHQLRGYDYTGEIKEDDECEKCYNFKPCGCQPYPSYRQVVEAYGRMNKHEDIPMVDGMISIHCCKNDDDSYIFRVWETTDLKLEPRELVGLEHSTANNHLKVHRIRTGEISRK